MQTIKFQNAKAEHPAYLEPNRNRMQKPVEGLSVLKLFTPKNQPAHAQEHTEKHHTPKQNA